MSSLIKIVILVIVFAGIFTQLIDTLSTPLWVELDSVIYRYMSITPYLVALALIDMAIIMQCEVLFKELVKDEIIHKGEN